MLFSEMTQNISKGMIFFLHLLMVTPTLFSFSGSNEGRHDLKDLLEPSHFLKDKVVVIGF